MEQYGNVWIHLGLRLLLVVRHCLPRLFFLAREPPLYRMGKQEDLGEWEGQTEEAETGGKAADGHW